MYITVAQADELLRNIPEWSTVQNKEELISRATFRLEALVFINENPERIGDRYVNGFVPDPSINPPPPIPGRLLKATALLALYYVKYPPQVVNFGQGGDPYPQEDANNQVGDLPVDVQNLVNPFLYTSKFNEAEKAKEDRQERRKLRPLQYDNPNYVPPSDDLPGYTPGTGDGVPPGGFPGQYMTRNQEQGLLWKDLPIPDVDNGLPEGGVGGQILEKVDDVDFNTQWVDPIPLARLVAPGGTEGQALTKLSGNNYDFGWRDERDPRVPDSNDDDFNVIAAKNNVWQNVPVEEVVGFGVPNGEVGQVLKKGQSGDAIWADESGGGENPTDPEQYTHLGSGDLLLDEAGVLNPDVTPENIELPQEYVMRFKDDLMGHHLPPGATYDPATGQLVLPEGQWDICAALNIVPSRTQGDFSNSDRGYAAIGIFYGESLRHAQAIYEKNFNFSTNVYQGLTGYANVAGIVRSDGVTPITIRCITAKQSFELLLTIQGAHLHAFLTLTGGKGDKGDPGSRGPKGDKGDSAVAPGGVENQVLTRDDGAEGGIIWKDIPSEIESRGTPRQYLTSQGEDLVWEFPIPEGGTVGAILARDNGNGTTWINNNDVPNGGTIRQVLAKASDTNQDLEWVTPSVGGGGWTENLLENPVGNGIHTIPGLEGAKEVWVELGLVSGSDILNRDSMTIVGPIVHTGVGPAYQKEIARNFDCRFTFTTETEINASLPGACRIVQMRAKY